MHCFSLKRTIMTCVFSYLSGESCGGGCSKENCKLIQISIRTAEISVSRTRQFFRQRDMIQKKKMLRFHLVLNMKKPGEFTALQSGYKEKLLALVFWGWYWWHYRSTFSIFFNYFITDLSQTQKEWNVKEVKTNFKQV